MRSEQNLGADRLRAAYGRFPSGVTAICGLHEGRPLGMAASSFTSVSLAPPLVSVCFGRTSATWPRLRTLPVLGISVLAEDHGAIARQLANKGADRMAGVDARSSASGAVFLTGACLSMEVAAEQELPAGDHTIVVFRVRSVEDCPEIEPLVFHGSNFRQLAR